MRRLFLLALLCLPVPARAAPDPLEPVNRQLHAFNGVVRTYALAPLAAAWRAHVPPEARAGIGRAVANAGEPLTALSAVAAGEFGHAWHATKRFGINTTLGWAGWRDAAAERGLAPRPMTPGDALCAWGVPSGPFLILPVLGPTTLRDAAAGVAAAAALAQGIGTAPVAGWQASDAFLAFDRVGSELARIEAESLDAYAVLRSAWSQRRAASCTADAAADEDQAAPTPR
jgi:phospholipid-binding lipoprotein MlaA